MKNQFETLSKFRLLDVLLMVVLMSNAGCRLVDGQDPGADALILSSMSISATCPIEASVAEPYSCQPDISISAEVDATQLVWELTPEHTCSWMQINPTTGQVFGVPSTSEMGPCVLALRVATSSDTSSNFVQQMNVRGPRVNFVDHNCPLTAPVDANYQCRIEATSPLTNAQVTYSLAPENKCAWATVNATTGVVSGKPSLISIGACQLAVKASVDSLSSSVSKFTLTVPSVAVSVTANCGTSAEAGVTYACSASATAPVTSPQFAWSLSASNTCAWASIHPSTGAISGTPLVQSVGPCRLDFMAKLPNGSFGQASYTVTVAPKAYNQLQLSDLNSDASEHAGKAVAIDGSFALVGSPDDNSGAGSVSIYRFDGSNWRKHAVFPSPDPAKIRTFGYAVAISGNSILVGAPGSKFNANSEGAVVAYEWNGSAWLQTQTILSPSSATSHSLNYFGAAVDMDGSRAIVASSHYNSEAAFVLNKSGSTWTVKAPLDFKAIGSSNGPDRIKVAVNGTLAVVSDTHGGTAYNGEVRMFREISGVWKEDGVLVSPAGSEFGASVDVYANKVLIGAPRERGSAGTAYLYEPGQNSWIVTGTFRAVDETTDQRCGSGVSLKSGQAVIGCAGANAKAGSVYVYKQATQWNLESKLVPTNSQNSDRFGGAVGLSGRDILIGAELFDSGANGDAGSAYIFRSKN